ncbi:S-layer homology domain-containing protein [Paenibacillaceae bacterium]|nr:S-layer homology domain-containing protein [Paenibacillaceae bacterium]
MKKNLGRMLLVLLMGAFLFPTVGNAANATDLTAQQKYDALVAKGIFAGINGEAALDQNMNRAQFARVAALILDLDGIGATDTKVVTTKPFSDVELTHWALEEIAAVKEAGIMVGNGNGTFSPSKDMTVQETAVAVGRVLDIEPVQGAKVEGVADWAAGYVQAIINAEIDFPTNYTEAATRADLASLAYQAEQVITERKEEEKKQKQDEEKKIEDEKKKLEEEKKKLEEEKKTEESTPAPTPTAPTPTLSKTPLDLINAASASGSWTNVNVTTFANAGITGVTTDNVSAVKVLLESGGSSPRTVSGIQAIVNAEITKQAALDLINAAAVSGVWTEVNATTFVNAGITGVTTDNVSAVKVVLESDGRSSWMVSEIQDIVDAEITKQAALDLINAAATSRSWTEVTETTFANAGVIGVTDEYLVGI